MQFVYIGLTYSLMSFFEMEKLKQTRAELVAKPRVGLPLLLRVENLYDLVSNDYND